MTEAHPHTSKAFHLFISEATGHSQAWMTAIQGLENACSLDKKTAELSYLAVLAALRLHNGIPFHVQSAREAGATREEVISALLVGLPAAGMGVTEALPLALASYESRAEVP